MTPVVISLIGLTLTVAIAGLGVAFKAGGVTQALRDVGEAAAELRQEVHRLAIIIGAISERVAKLEGRVDTPVHGVPVFVPSKSRGE